MTKEMIERRARNIALLRAKAQCPSEDYYDVAMDMANTLLRVIKAKLTDKAAVLTIKMKANAGNEAKRLEYQHKADIVTALIGEIFEEN